MEWIEAVSSIIDWFKGLPPLSKVVVVGVVIVVVAIVIFVVIPVVVRPPYR